MKRVKLERARHVRYLKSGLKGLPTHFVSLDASTPWLVYWMVHSLDLLDIELSLEMKLK